MAGTFTQLYVQIVFAVKGRQNLISRDWKDELHKYIAGIIKGKGHKSIIVNGMPDHIHIFVGLKPSMAVSDLVRDIKSNSSNFINEKRFVRGQFSWQEGYGRFRMPTRKLSTFTTISCARRFITKDALSVRSIWSC